jgi:hypothetical protein
MLPLRPAPGPVMVPPQGKLVYDYDGIRFEFYTREEGIDLLTKCREGNNRPIGNPAKEIDIMLAGVVGYSSPIPITAITREPAPRDRLIDKVNSWLMNVYSGGVEQLKYVNALEANRRAAICARCPKNKQWRDSCTSCNAHAKRAIDTNVVLLSQNKRTPNHDRLFACSVTGQENKVSVWLDVKHHERRKRFLDKLPPQCWLKTL